MATSRVHARIIGQRPDRTGTTAGGAGAGLAVSGVHAEIIGQGADRTETTAAGLPQPWYHGGYPGIVKTVLSGIWDGAGNAVSRTDAWVRGRTRPLDLRSAAEYVDYDMLPTRNVLFRIGVWFMKIL